MAHDLRARLGTGPPVLLDGGLATTLEAGGLTLPRPLWSAHALIAAPEAVERAHRAFVDAGAEVVLTTTYQLSPLGLRKAGIDEDRHSDLTSRAVTLARRAAEAAAGSVWVAGSLGPYGAALADGSEYTGTYAHSPDGLRDHHGPRLEALVAAGVDAIAIETVPSGAEVALLAELLDGLGLPAWVSVTLAGDGTRTPSGEPLPEALAPAAEVSDVIAIGVNCCPPTLVAPALQALAPLAHNGVSLLAKPNAGARWDAVHQAWRCDHAPVDPTRWLATGARLVGGCCGTSPEDLTTLTCAVRGAGPM